MQLDAANDNARLSVAEIGFLIILSLIGATEIGAGLWLIVGGVTGA